MITNWNLFRKKEPEEGQYIAYVPDYEYDKQYGNWYRGAYYKQPSRSADGRRIELKIYAWRPVIGFTANDLAELKTQEEGIINFTK